MQERKQIVGPGQRIVENKTIQFSDCGGLKQIDTTKKNMPNNRLHGPGIGHAKNVSDDF